MLSICSCVSCRCAVLRDINATNPTNPAILFGRGTWSWHQGLLWGTSGWDGNTTFHTTASTADPNNITMRPGNLPGYRVYGWRRTA
jgi:hypothetical protein